MGRHNTPGKPSFRRNLALDPSNMFNNTVNLRTTTNGLVEVGVTDYSKPGRVVRKGVTDNLGSTGTPVSLITATQVSRENKAVGTDRVLVRVEADFWATLDGEPTLVTPQVSVIISKTKVPEVTPTVMRELLCMAITLIERGDAATINGLSTVTATPAPQLRLLTGEL